MLLNDIGDLLLHCGRLSHLICYGGLYSFITWI
jgi:hypothetical protein